MDFRLLRVRFELGSGWNKAWRRAQRAPVQVANEGPTRSFAAVMARLPPWGRAGSGYRLGAAVSVSRSDTNRCPAVAHGRDRRRVRAAAPTRPALRRATPPDAGRRRCGAGNAGRAGGHLLVS